MKNGCRDISLKQYNSAEPPLLTLAELLRQHLPQNAALDTILRISTPTSEVDWFSTAIPSDGSYGIPEGLIFSYPLRSKGNGDYEIVQGIELNEFSQEKIRATRDELEMEREAVKKMLS